MTLKIWVCQVQKSVLQSVIKRIVLIIIIQIVAKSAKESLMRISVVQGETKLITWLRGVKRIRGGEYTKEISGFRCSNCNYFALRPMMKCPECGGDYAVSQQEYKKWEN